jgi:hypothetical protein
MYTASAVSVNGTSTIANGSWATLAFVSRSRTLRELYVNGVLENTDITSDDYVSAVNTIGFGIFHRTSIAYYVGQFDYAYIYNRDLAASEVAWLYREPFAFMRRQRVELLGIGEVGGVTYTGSGGATVTKATASASATYAAPVYTATGSPSATKATGSASATYAVPVYSATGTPSITKAIGAASGTFAVPVYVSIGSPSATKASASASGTYAVPVYTAAGNPLVSKATAYAAGMFVVPTYSATGSPSVTKPRASATGTHAVPIYSASGAASVTKAVASASGLYGVFYAGSGNASATKPTASADGTFLASGVSVASIAFFLLKRRH